MNTFQHAMGYCSTASVMASRFAWRSPKLGSACAWSSTRSSWHAAAATRRAWSIASGESGLPAGAIGNADSTTIDVSLRRKTSSMKWSSEKQTRGSASPHCCCGKPVQKSRPGCVAGSPE